MPDSLPNTDSYWMPFTANRQFKARPKLLVSAKDMHYKTADGATLLDGTAGLWCVNAGHSRPKIVEAIQRQAAELDYAPPFQVAHPAAFENASRVAALLPGDLNKVFFVNSGSESVDTALKIAIAYHRVRGQGTRTRIIGRERGYHGVGFGGISVGGIPNNRKVFGSLTRASTSAAAMPPCSRSAPASLPVPPGSPACNARLYCCHKAGSSSGEKVPASACSARRRMRLACRKERRPARTETSSGNGRCYVVSENHGWLSAAAAVMRCLGSRHSRRPTKSLAWADRLGQGGAE